MSVIVSSRAEFDYAAWLLKIGDLNSCCGSVAWDAVDLAAVLTAKSTRFWEARAGRAAAAV